MASKSDGLLEYESLLDSLVNIFTNGLAKPQTKPKQKPSSFTSESSGAENGNNPEQSQNSSSAHVTDKIKNNENSKEQYSVNMNNETLSSEVSVLVSFQVLDYVRLKNRICSRHPQILLQGPSDRL